MVCILYKPSLELFTADWLSQHNHKENKDRDTRLSINISAIETAVDLPVCTSIHDIQEATTSDVHLQELNAYIIKGWLHKKDVVQDLQQYWPIRHELALIDGMAIKGKLFIVPSQLHVQILIQLHSNNMGIEKIRLLVGKSVYWVNVSVVIENTVKNVPVV